MCWLKTTTEASVSLNNCITSWFTMPLGVKQGEILSTPMILLSLSNS
uniref:Reverse transcriptase domain-containing protein n=1 Tax=Anguilla anguilla TaxID=7936 RepID=A0A0E9T9Z5_ANGAN